MTKYKKKPVVIEAVKNCGKDNWPEVFAFITSRDANMKKYAQQPDGKLKIETLEGIMMADVGDWIICGIKGEFYPIKDDIFKKTYELVEE